MVHQNTGEALSRLTRRTPEAVLQAEAKAFHEVAQALAALDQMDLAALRARHLELFHEPARSKNPTFLRKKLAFRIQERIEGGLPAWAEARVRDIAPQGLPGRGARSSTLSQPKVRGPQTVAVASAPLRDPRLPGPGVVLVREYKGFAHEVEVREAGFRYRGRDYASLSTIAKEITGTPWNGFLFFGLQDRKQTKRAEVNRGE